MAGSGGEAAPPGPEHSPGLSYPFDAFLSDLDALSVMSHLHDTPSHGFLQAALGHFRARYTQRRVRIHRLIRFLLAVTYLDEHFHHFDTGEFAVYGSDRAGGLVSEDLLRAIHRLFAVPDVFALNGPPAPAEVLALARGLQSERAAPTPPPSRRVRPRPPA